MESDTSNRLTGLAYYVEEVLFREFAQNRKALETKWRNNEAAYRSTPFGKAWRESQSGDDDEAASDDMPAKACIPLTRTKIVAAVAMILDTAMGNGDIPFLLEPDPLDEAIIAEATQEEQAPGFSAIKKNEALIRSQTKLTHADRTFLKAVLSEAVYGETVLKWNVVTVRGTQMVQTAMPPMQVDGLPVDTGQTVWEKVETEQIVPTVEYIPVWDVFRDMETDDLNAGAGVIHRRMVSPYWLRQKIGKEFWIDDAIEDAIGFDTTHSSGSVPTEQDTMAPLLHGVDHRRNTIRYLETSGRVPRRVYEDWLTDQRTPINFTAGNDSDGDEIEVLCGTANGYVVWFAPPEHDGFRGYFRGKWEDDLDERGGVGVADNLAAIQNAMDGVFANFMANKKLTASVILALKSELIKAWDRKINPVTTIELSDHCTDARAAIQQLTFPDAGQTLLAMIAILERWADEASLVPKAAQGGSAAGGQTAFEISQLMQGSGRYIGMVIRRLDEDLIEPFIARMLQWNMEDPDLPDELKGNFRATAQGVTAYKNRIVRIQYIQALLAMASQNPAIAAEVKISELMAELVSDWNLPVTTLRSEADKQKDAEAAAAQRQQDLADQQAMMQAKAGLDIQKEEAKHPLRMEQQAGKIQGAIEQATLNAGKELKKQEMADQAAVEQIVAKHAMTPEKPNAGGATA